MPTLFIGLARADTSQGTFERVSRNKQLPYGYGLRQRALFQTQLSPPAHGPGPREGANDAEAPLREVLTGCRTGLRPHQERHGLVRFRLRSL